MLPKTCFTILFLVFLLGIMVRYKSLVLDISPISQPDHISQQQIKLIDKYQLVPLQAIKLENGVTTNETQTKNLSLNYEERIMFDLCTIPDWKELMKPCESTIRWDQRETDRTKQTSLAFSRIELIIKPVGYPSSLTIHTRDTLGREKSYGGDSWLITLDGKDYRYWFHLADRRNGSYDGAFVIKQAGRFSLAVYLEFTLCDGLRDPPPYWYREGFSEPDIGMSNELRRRYTFMLKDFLFDRSSTIEFLVEEIREEPDFKIEDFRGLPRNKCGYWKSRYFHTIGDQKKTSSYNLINNYRTNKTKLGTLLVGGDSVLRNFYHNLKDHGVCKDFFKVCRNHYSWINKRIDQRIKWPIEKELNLTEFIQHQFVEQLTSDLLSNKSYILINFGLHLILRASFDECKNAFILFIKTLSNLKRDFGDSHFPKIIWKSTSPSRLEVVKPATFFRFMTRPRIELWNAYTMSEARKINLPVLDVYDVALSSINGHTDQVHYKPFVYKKLVEQLRYLFLKNN